MTEVYLRKVRGGGFWPADERAEDFARGVREGEIIKSDMKRPRNGAQHRLYFALLSKVQENTDDRWPNTDALLQAVKIALGHFDTMQLVDGRIVPHPRSISFGSMPQDDFRRFFDDTVKLVITKIIPGLDRNDLMREINEMVGN